MAKKKTRTTPGDAVFVRTYVELSQYIQAFADGHLNLLIVLGGPGLAKSQTVRGTVGPQTCWIEGNASPFGIYTKLYKHRDKLVVIDDVDNLYSDKTAVRLLKLLCQTDPIKTVAWETAAAENADVPRNFQTSSKACIIANDWKTLSENVRAIEDRGHMIVFEPSLDEIHRQVATFFEDQEVFDWMAGHLHFLDSPSMRSYVRAAELKNAGLPWRRIMLEQSLPKKTAIVADLKCDPRYESENERIEAFADGGHGSRATYFNHAKRLRNIKRVSVEEIKLKRKRRRKSA